MGRASASLTSCFSCATMSRAIASMMRLISGRSNDGRDDLPQRRSSGGVGAHES
jgi:hypothetical protein